MCRLEGRHTFTAAAASPFGFNSAPAFWGVCAVVAVGAVSFISAQIFERGEWQGSVT